jgi:hypothetical protein
MAESKEAKGGFDVFKALREGRDAGMDKWAKVALRLTSSRPYQRITSAIARPALLATALMRTATETAMSTFLAQVNMPSREEVLSLSKRLTRIEMVLDDLGAGMDQLRRTAAAPASASAGSAQKPRRERESSREPSNNNESRTGAASAAASEG